jgi:hypothetical protein
MDLKVTLLTGETGHLGKGEYFNIDMPADLDQFG